MIGCGGGGAQVEETEVRVGGHGGKQGRVVRGEGGRVGTAVYWDGHE